jgi:hypothetical protein
VKHEQFQFLLDDEVPPVVVGVGVGLQRKLNTVHPGVVDALQNDGALDSCAADRRREEQFSKERRFLPDALGDHVDEAPGMLGTPLFEHRQNSAQPVLREILFGGLAEVILQEISVGDGCLRTNLSVASKLATFGSFYQFVVSPFRRLREQLVTDVGAVAHDVLPGDGLTGDDQGDHSHLAERGQAVQVAEESVDVVHFACENGRCWNAST